MLISDALAQTAPAASEPSQLPTVVLMMAMFAIFYFLIIRPQQKKFKEHQNMVNSVRRGDKVITSGGIVGMVSKVENEEDLLHVEIAEGVKVKVVRSTIASVVARTGDAEVESKKAKKAA